MLLCTISFGVQSQKLVLEKSRIVFFSDAPVEDILAENVKTAGLFNPLTGDIAFSVPIRGFQFEKSLMQEHFNEKYMESDKYPKATFQGTITGLDAGISIAQQVTAKGELTIHGVMKAVEIPGVIERRADEWILKTKFMVKLSDHNIRIPRLVFQHITEQIEVTADFTFRVR